jgi:hypothetical protein
LSHVPGPTITRASFKHLVSASEQSWRHVETVFVTLGPSLAITPHGIVADVFGARVRVTGGRSERQRGRRFAGRERALTSSVNLRHPRRSRNECMDIQEQLEPRHHYGQQHYTMPPRDPNDDDDEDEEDEEDEDRDEEPAVVREPDE